MAANGSVNFNLAVTEVVAGGDGYASVNVEHAMARFSGLTTSRTFSSTGDPTWTTAWSDTVDLSGGTALIDLTALTRPDPYENVSFAGISIVAWGFAGAAANTAAIEVAPDATNGYNIFGTADDKISVYPNQVVIGCSMADADLAAVVDATNDEILFTGSGTEQVHVLLIGGA